MPLPELPNDEQLVKIEDPTEFLKLAKRRLEDRRLENAKSTSRGLPVQKLNHKGSQKKDTEIFLDASNTHVNWKTTGTFHGLIKSVNSLPVANIMRVEEKQDTFVLVTPVRSYAFSTNNQAVRELWVRFLREQQVDKRRRVKDDPFLAYMQELWDSVDTDRSGNLKLDEVARVMACMNITCSKDKLQKQFEELDKDKSKSLDEDEFLECMRQLFSDRPEVAAIMRGATARTLDQARPVLTIQEALGFFERQGSEVTRAVLERMAPSLAGKAGDAAGVDVLVFARLLDSDENSAWDPLRLGARREEGYMGRPLSWYWINSSHNTYLTGDQLASVSSAEQYASVLQRGCRCVEIDCWDGAAGVPEGNKGDEPVVTHGHTVCTKVLFRDVIRAIKNSAFGPPARNRFPVMLSVEMHCSAKFQQRMADICTEELGDTLYVIGEDPLDARRLPSPERLQGRIIIKGKLAPPAEAPHAAEEESSGSEDDDVAAAEMAAKPPALPPPAAAAAAAAGAGKGKGGDKGVKKGKSAITPEWSALVGLSARPFKGPDKPGKAFEMSSLAEGKTRKVCSKWGRELAEYNRTQLSRIYPYGGRVDSSNQDPLLPWAAGCQLVALNYQTWDVPMQLNTGKFLQNGNCGYVLKSDALLGAGQRAGPVRVRVVVLSCQRIPGGGKASDIVDPYVVVELHSPGAGPVRKATKAVNNNGFNPVFPDGDLGDFVAEDGDACLLRIAVMDDDTGTDRLAAVCCLPVSAVRAGVRHVPLWDARGEEVPYAGVLCRFDIDPPPSPSPPHAALALKSGDGDYDC